VIDGNGVATRAGLGGRINTVMQVCFFAVADVLPMDEALASSAAIARADLRARSAAPRW
jgi:Pyruvate/2-oxoacid:ferredoxin oxidoreductase gamma subunit